MYKSTGPIAVAGTVTLDGQGDPSSVFIFQIADTLITGSASNILLTNSAQACNVCWQVASSATLATNSTFRGTVMALTSISVQIDVVIDGRVLARNGQVSLDTDLFRSGSCTAGSSTPTATTSPSVFVSASTTTTPSAAAPTPTATATGPGSTATGTGTGTSGGLGREADLVAGRAGWR